MSISPYRNGFTLIELSIVIVIIGLIVAGVVGGQKLVRQAQLRSVITEVDTYKIAYHTFFLQYGGVPGDIENATDYWSGTANGNGNKAIHWSTETLRTWQQLSLAKLIPGSYTGAKIGSHGKLGANVPASKLSPVSYLILSQDGSNAIYGKSKLSNAIRTGILHTNGLPRVAFLSPAEAYSIDKKVDDGHASYGTAVTFQHLYGTDSDVCVTGSHNGSAGNSSYVLSDTTVSCFMQFWIN